MQWSRKAKGEAEKASPVLNSSGNGSFPTLPSSWLLPPERPVPQVFLCKPTTLTCPSIAGQSTEGLGLGQPVVGAIFLVLRAEERFGNGVGVVRQGRCLAWNARHHWATMSSHVHAAAAPPERRWWDGGAAGGLCWWASHSQPPYPDNPSLLLAGRTSHTQFSFSACCFRGLMRPKAVKDAALGSVPTNFEERILCDLLLCWPCGYQIVFPIFVLQKEIPLFSFKKKTTLACKSPAPYSRLWLVLTVFASWAKIVRLSRSTFPTVY